MYADIVTSKYIKLSYKATKNPEDSKRRAVFHWDSRPSLLHILFAALQRSGSLCESFVFSTAALKKLFIFIYSVNFVIIDT